MKRVIKRIEKLSDMLADLEARRKEVSISQDEVSAELDGINSWLESNSKIAKLTELIPSAKMAEGELSYITKGQYRKYWGREPKNNILTSDGKRVHWEYALDELAQELGLEREYGYKADEALRDLIKLAKGYKERKRVLLSIPKRQWLKGVETKMENVSIKLGRAEQVVDTQEDRSQRAIAGDAAKLAKNVVPLNKPIRWLKHPERYDIKGVDTPSKHKATTKKRSVVKPGIRGIR